MPRIIDCCTFFNENDLFRLRFAELGSCVDHFIVAEATRAHSGARKSIFLDTKWLSSAANEDKVLHFIIDDMPIIETDAIANRWLPEHFQRDSIIRPLVRLNLSDDDIVLISDVDEIPSASAVNRAVELLKDFKIAIFEQTMKKFFVNNESATHFNNTPWLGTVACKYFDLKQMLPQAARLGDPLCPRAACLAHGYGRDLYPYETRVSNAGWHLSSMGGLGAVLLKGRSIAEGSNEGRPSGHIHDVPESFHNFRSFREKNKEAITHFIEDVCPQLLPVRADDPRTFDGLTVPEACKNDVVSYQSLFYLEEPLGA